MSSSINKLMKKLQLTEQEMRGTVGMTSYAYYALKRGENVELITIVKFLYAVRRHPDVLTDDDFYELILPLIDKLTSPKRSAQLLGYQYRD